MTTWTQEPWVKDPEAVLDYQFNWGGNPARRIPSWLAEGEIIAGHSIIAETGITVDSSSVTDGVVTVWLSGGTAGETYRVTCRINTSGGRVDDRTNRVIVRQR